MDTDRTARLTEGQKACLRLVLRHMSSKDIARELGISPHTVDQRLRTAMKLLGAGSRVQAAFMLAKVEGIGSYQSSAYQSLDVAPEADRPTLAPSDNGWRQDQGQRFEAVREEQAAFATTFLPPAQTLRLPLPKWGAQPHDLGTWQRAGWIVAITMGALVTFGVFIAGLEALVRLSKAIP
jgi:DNA-binding CsgD family transcriptional regulator